VISHRLEHHRVHLEGLARGIPRPWQLLGDSRQRLDDRWERLASSFAVGLDRRRTRIARIAGELRSPLQRIVLGRSQLQAEERALNAGVQNVLRERRSHLDRVAALLNSFSYQRVLERGFVLVRDAEGTTVTSVTVLRPAAQLSLRFHDGEARVSVVGRQPSASATRRSRADDTNQGRLL
jgi:exodeoxyribonuclease VII large subunit